MASTEKIFYNAVRGMNREQMMAYVSKYAEDDELRVLLFKFNELRKGCVLAEETNATLLEANRYLAELHIQECLITLEGRIKMLILSQYMANNLNDKKRMLSNRQRITALLEEYRLVGGRESLQSPH